MQKKDNTNRKEKLESLLQQLVGEVLRDYINFDNALVTVSKVEASNDLKWAKIWISIIGANDDVIFNLINKNIYDIQGEVNQTLSMKMPPRLQFFLDTSPRHAQHIDELIKKVHEEDNT